MRYMLFVILFCFILTGCTYEEGSMTSTEQDVDYENRIKELEEELEKVTAIQYLEEDVEEETYIHTPEAATEEPKEEAEQTEVLAIEEDKEEVVKEEEKEEDVYATSLPEGDMVREARAEVIQQGEEFQVSTIMGTGVGTQGNNTMYYPAYTQVSDAGEIFFVDGDINNQKIRKIKNGKIEIVMDLTNNKLNQSGKFFTTGLIHMGKNLLMISNSFDIFYIDGGRIHRVPGDVPKYMEDHHLVSIWRLKKQGDDIYIMFKLKGYAATYHIAQYDIETDTLTPIIERSDYYHPFNFYVDDNNIYVATQMGYIYRDQLFPKQKTAFYHAKDSEVTVTDVWKTAGGEIMFSLHDGSYAWIMKEEGNSFANVAGSIRGYQDGVLDEVMMDNPMDFTYDGSGYIFVDPGNHVIRKLWTSLRPEKDI